MQQGVKTKFWENVLSIIHDYLQENTNPETPVVNYLSGTELTKALELSLSHEGASEAEILKEIKNYLHYSVRTTHPLFNNQLNAGANFESLVGEMISFLTNTTLATYEVAPVATLLENKLIDELNARIGFHGGDGIMLTGGSNANLMAIHVARNERFPEIKQIGNQQTMKIFVSREAHYSHKKAMMLLGMGLNNLVVVKPDAYGRMDAQDLEKKIQETIANDEIPLMVCSTAGTTVLGSFDPIEKNNEICKKYNVWHHVDGAWGGAVMFSKKYQHLLKGIEAADSFTFDAHKLLGTGLITSFFLTKKNGVLASANSGGGSHYLFHEYENQDFDLGKKSLQCGRKVDSLKFWLTWKAKGHLGLEQDVDAQFEKQIYFTQLIKDNPRFQLIMEPEFLNVCFQVIPKDQTVDINQYNLDLRFKIVRSGKLMTNFSSFEDGTIFFRQVFANHTTTKDDLKRLLDTIIEFS